MVCMSVTEIDGVSWTSVSSTSSGQQQHNTKQQKGVEPRCFACSTMQPYIVEGNHYPLLQVVACNAKQGTNIGLQKRVLPMLPSSPGAGAPRLPCGWPQSQR